MLKRIALLIFLAGCHTEEPGVQELSCGANTMVRGGCAARCPAPCTCVTVFKDHLNADFVPFELCAKPCTAPGTCPGKERCAVINGSSPVCLPWTLESPKTGSISISVDCFPEESFSAPRCRNGHLVQYQPFYCTGILGGSLCADALLRTCTGGCTTSDAGAPSCAAAVDAGAPAEAGTCCPTFRFSGCRSLGGVKRPQQGCGMSCCTGCVWTSGKDSYGCETWKPVIKDAGTEDI